MVKLTRADQLKLEADKERVKSVSFDVVSVDFYDTDILEKTLQKLHSDGGKLNPGNNNVNGEQKQEPEFHEQFFS